MADTSAFMVYHESVKHIIPMYDASEKKTEDTEDLEAASYNKRVSNVPHTIFCCRQTLAFRHRHSQAYFIGDSTENKRISFLLFAQIFSASASFISRRSKQNEAKKKRHQNEIFYAWRSGVGGRWERKRERARERKNVL